MRSRLLVMVCVLLLTSGLSASPTCILTGRVRDARTGEPLVGASVIINGTEYGNATDLKGDYIIIRLPEITGAATAAYVGCDDTSARFITAATCTTRLDFSLYRIQPIADSHLRPARRPHISLPLPVRSVSRLGKYWGAEMSMLAIKQVGDSVLIQTIGPRLIDTPNWNGPSTKEGIIPIAEFRTFWDSLEFLNFWGLNNAYRAPASRSDQTGGYISVSFEPPDGVETTKAVRFFAPGSCSLQFRQVYSLFENMARFARSVPDWRTLLRSETEEPIEGLKDLYHAEALQAIAAARDSQGLDTLLSMLMRNDEYATAVVMGLVNIDSSLAVATLEKLLARLEADPPSTDRGQLALATSKILVRLNGRQSAPAIRHYISVSYNRSLISDWCVLLASVGDYSVVPEVVEILSDSSRYRSDYVRKAAGALKQIGYRSRTVISALYQAAQREMKENHPDDETVVAILRVLMVLTGEEFKYNSTYSLEVKRASMAEWLRWWEANARRFPVAPKSGPADGYGFIQVNSTPSVVAISLDSLSTGNTTPFLLLNVAAGEHDLRLTKERYADWSTTVKVTQGLTTTVDAVLSATPVCESGHG
ncbi:MAG: PEGA domain-containing protein [candidate division WOR-3 bacterium]|nr:PEGA domain-containing protein [candidate division WOR-3 bacterium]